MTLVELRGHYKLMITLIYDAGVHGTALHSVFTAKNSATCKQSEHDSKRGKTTSEGTLDYGALRCIQIIHARPMTGNCSFIGKATMIQGRPTVARLSVNLLSHPRSTSKRRKKYTKRDPSACHLNCRACTYHTQPLDIP